ncbi:Uncharacterised protein [Vibrio cholerae]|nr:Uncharacterised protein [Vibrio cholerae]CSD10678.1 Uncharacterised protein [Vibrio cholerae]
MQDTTSHTQKSRDPTGSGASKNGQSCRHPWINSCHNRSSRHRSAHWETAVDAQIREIQHSES